jgi:isopenicillin N synthase-like dioxygenase
LRAAAHEDINLITLMAGASAGGLQLQQPDGTWVDVCCDEEHIVVNIGDMLQRLTNGRLSSTTHRVITVDGDVSRFSVPFFVHPRAGTSLACLECCVDTARPKAYSDISSDAYLRERLHEIGLA